MDLSQTLSHTHIQRGIFELIKTRTLSFNCLVRYTYNVRRCVVYVANEINKLYLSVELFDWIPNSYYDTTTVTVTHTKKKWKKPAANGIRSDLTKRAHGTVTAEKKNNKTKKWVFIFFFCHFVCTGKKLPNEVSIDWCGHQSQWVRARWMDSEWYRGARRESEKVLRGKHTHTHSFSGERKKRKINKYCKYTANGASMKSLQLSAQKHTFFCLSFIGCCCCRCDCDCDRLRFGVTYCRYRNQSISFGFICFNYYFFTSYT